MSGFANVRRDRPMILYGLTALVIGAAAVAIMLYSLSLTSRAHRRHAAFIRLTDTVQQNVATAHVWFEEALGGDPSIDVPVDVYARLDAALALVEAGLAGGDTEIGHLEPLSAAAPRAVLQRLEERVRQLRAAAHSRWRERETSGGIGGSDDQDFDAVFREILDLCSRIAREMDTYIAHDLRVARWMTGAVVVLFVALFFATMLSLVRARRAVGMRARELESLVDERTASLAASEVRTRRVNEELAQARDEAEEMSRAKSQFLANISHEIRTPMNGVLGMASLLLRTKLSVRQREYVQAVHTSGSALLRLINDILDFSKLEADKLPLESIDVDLRRLIKEVADLFAPEATRKGVALELEVANDVPALVGGDPVRIGQVLSNLVSNAIKFTDRGTVRIRCMLVGHREDVVPPHADIRFEVRDTGIGIEPEVSARLFQPFTQADGSITRRYGGTGLGLAISRQLVELMRGDIGAASEPGIGSTFWFTTRLETRRAAHGTTPSLAAAGSLRAVAPVPPPVASESAADGEPTLSPTAPRVLVVEDNRVNQIVTRHMLKELGYHADIVESGLQVEPALTAYRYAVVLMDCQMPDLDGYRATRAIRGRGDDRAGVPIIALTAHALEGEREKALAAGMDDFLTKPVRLEELSAVLKRWIPTPFAADLVAPIVPAVRAPAAPDGILDAERLRRLRAGQTPEFFDELVDLFVTESRHGLAILRDAVDAGEPEAVRAEAHKLLGSCRNFGALRMAQLCAALESASAASDLEAAARTLTALSAEFRRTSTALGEERRMGVT